MTTLHRPRLSGGVCQNQAPQRPCGSIRKRAVQQLAKLIAVAVVCAGMVAIYKIVGAAVQDGMIAAMLTLLLYLPFVTLCARRR